MELLLYPDERLRVRAESFGERDMDEARRVAAQMLDLMYDKNGVGLAGPQVGIQRSIFVLDVSQERDSPLVLINPKVERLEGSQEAEEGCLSFPRIYAPVKRAAFAVFSFIDASGEPRSLEGTQLLARALQHEFDHLEGVLFIDRLGLAGRLSIRKSLREMESAAGHVR